VKLSIIVCDMVMTVAHCLQQKWNYVMEYMHFGDMGQMLIDVGRFSERERERERDNSMQQNLLWLLSLCTSVALFTGRQLLLLCANVIEMIVNRSVCCLC
jgi:hypothetical protein